MPYDPQYLLFPKWLEESGLPERLEQELGSGAWTLFKRLVEADVEHNAWPDWFAASPGGLARWTGLPLARTRELIGALVEGGYLKKRVLHVAQDEYRLAVAMPLPGVDRPEAIAARLQARGQDPARALWRYHQAEQREDAFARVQTWYHETFGLALNPAVVQDLAELAQRYAPGLLREAFQAAGLAGAKSLRWVFEYLSKQEGKER